MNKIRAWFMTILIMVGVMSSSGVIVADGLLKAAPEEYVSSEVMLKDNVDNNVTYGGDKTIYEHLYTKADNPAITGAYSVIKLDRNKFKAPVVSDVTNGDNYIKRAEVDDTSDADNYLIKLYYNEIPATGTDVKVPFVVHTKGMPSESTFPISDKTYDDQGSILSNGSSLTLKYAIANPTIDMGIDSNETVSEEIVSETDNTITKEVPGILLHPELKSKAGTSTVDDRTFKLTVQLPDDYKFDDTFDYSKYPENDVWQYDAKTNRATYENAPNGDGTHSWDLAEYLLPVTAKVGAKVGVASEFKGTLTAVGDDNNVIDNDDVTVTLNKKEVVDVPGEAYKSFAAYEGNNNNNETITANTKNINLLGNLYATGNFRNGGSSTSKLNEYVDTIVDEPQSDIDYSKLAGDSEAKKTVNEGDYSVYNQIWLNGNFSEDNKLAVAKNKVTIEYTDGTSDVINNLKPSTNNEYFNIKDPKPVKRITLKFDNPIHVTDTDGYNMMVGLEGNMTEPAIKDVVNSDYQNANIKNNMMVYYANNPNHKASTYEADALLTKKIPSVTNANVDWASVDNEDLLPGGTVNYTAAYNVKNADALQAKDRVLKNGKMFFLVDTGVKLGDTSKITSLTNVKTEYNYKNTGKTAIYGDITNGDLSDTSNSSTRKLSYTIPLTNTNALDKGWHYVESYLVFDNNGLDSYNLTKMSDKGSFETADLDNYFSNSQWKIDNHGLYDNTEKPTAFLGERADFSFTPSAALTATNLVEQGSTSNNWVEDTGKLANQAGDEFTYLLKTSNYSMNQDFNDIDAIDVLPTIGDKFITDSSKDRGSEFSVGLRQAVQDVPKGYHVMYSTDEPKDKYEDNQVANWFNSVTDYSKVTMVRLQANKGTTLLHDKSVSVELNVNTPDNIDYKTDLETDNTFAVYGKTADLKSALVESNKSVIRTVGADPVIENGSMQISKIDAADATKHLAGASFKITSADGTVKTGTTNQAGELNVADLTAGTYKVVETQSPTGYQLDSTEQTVKVTANQTAKVMFLDKREVVNPTTGNMKLVKVAAQDKNKKLAGAHFKIVDTNGKSQQAVTNSDGEIDLNNLVAGTYEVTETKAPVGYDLDTTTRQVAIKVGETTTLTINNKLTGGSGTITPTTPTKPAVKPGVTAPKNDGRLPQTGEQIVAGSVVFLVVLLTAGFGALCLYQYRTKKR